LLKHVAAQEAWTMIDLSLMRDHPTVAAPRRWVEDLNELYCQTKAAEVLAEQHGFAGTAAALADIAATLAWEPGVDPTVVWAVGGCRPASRTGPSGAGKPRGASDIRH
jgi:hypothetical protein